MFKLIFMNKFIKYFRVWIKLTTVATQIAFTSRFGAMIFIFGKLLRFILFVLFLILLLEKTKTIAGYTLWQVILFYATFNLVDALPQFFLREVYRFRMYVVSGFFDYILIKPFSPLFRSLFGGSDILDLSILVLSVAFIFISFGNAAEVSLISILVYVLFIINAFVVSIAFHIFVLSVGILTTEVDNTVMLYRDLTLMGRVPIDVYREPISFIITFIVPVGLMTTFPVKAVLGLLSFNMIIFSFFLGLIFISLALIFWDYSVKRYTSASS